jgi:hypothetical protein
MEIKALDKKKDNFGNWSFKHVLNLFILETRRTYSNLFEKHRQEIQMESKEIKPIKNGTK